MSSTHDKRPHFVYELWSSDDTCLYIGMSLNPQSRMNDHRRYQPWWPEVAHIYVTEYDGWRAAAWAERSRIFMERPVGNLQWNPSYDKSLAQRAAFVRLNAALAAKQTRNAA